MNPQTKVISCIRSSSTQPRQRRDALSKPKPSQHRKPVFPSRKPPNLDAVPPAEPTAGAKQKDATASLPKPPWRRKLSILGFQHSLSEMPGRGSWYDDRTLAVALTQSHPFKAILFWVLGQRVRGGVSVVGILTLSLAQGRQGSTQIRHARETTQAARIVPEPF